MKGYSIKQTEQIVIIDDVMALDGEAKETIKFLKEIGFAVRIKQHRANSSSVKKDAYYKEKLTTADYKKFEQMKKNESYFKACAWAKERLEE